MVCCAGSTGRTGALVVGSTGVTQHVTIGVDPEALAKFAQVLIEQLAQLPLDPSTRLEVGAALTDVKNEAAKPSPDHGRVRKAFERAVGYLVDAGKPVLTAAFFLLAQRYLGMPPQ